MNATGSTTTASPAAAPAEPAAPAGIDASCRVPLLFLFAGAAIWLVAGSLFGLVASLKMHMPGLLADCAWFTYGRVQAAQVNSLVYGFGVQAALGVALWLIARLGRTPLVTPGTVVAGTIFWNVGVKIGVFGILIGDSTGYEWFEMPGYASPILFVGYAMIGSSALLTFHSRREKTLYVSQWFLLAALFWFPWIYTTASLLLIYFPVRGVLQATVDGWYIHNLNQVWFGFIGLAALFYFLPTFARRPLHSRYLAVLAFWTLALFGGWGGVHFGAPVPSWIPGVCTVFTVLGVVPLIANAMNFRQTAAGAGARLKATVAGRFMGFGAIAYLAAGALVILNSLPQVWHLTRFTLFTPALVQLSLYGFFGMTMFGAIYEIVPRLLPAGWPSGTWPVGHFILSGAGVALYTLSLFTGGLAQGAALNDPAKPFSDVLHTALVFFRIGTLGDILMAAGNVLLAVNIGWLVVRCCRAWCAARSAAARTPVPEVAR